MSRYEIDERCSCGATFKYSGDGNYYAQSQAESWRLGHRHEVAAVEPVSRKQTAAIVPVAGAAWEIDLKYPCPECGAEKGWRCVLPNGNQTHPHRARALQVTAAEREAVCQQLRDQFSLLLKSQPNREEGSS